MWFIIIIRTLFIYDTYFITINNLSLHFRYTVILLLYTPPDYLLWVPHWLNRLGIQHLVLGLVTAWIGVSLLAEIFQAWISSNFMVGSVSVSWISTFFVCLYLAVSVTSIFLAKPPVSCRFVLVILSYQSRELVSMSSSCPSLSM